jgi:hypothetical protein
VRLKPGFAASDRLGFHCYNGQEFAIDILDIRWNDDGSFSTWRLPSPRVIMGSDKTSDTEMASMPDTAISEMNYFVFSEFVFVFGD